MLGNQYRASTHPPFCEQKGRGPRKGTPKVLYDGKRGNRQSTNAKQQAPQPKEGKAYALVVVEKGRKDGYDANIHHYPAKSGTKDHQTH